VPRLFEIAHPIASIDELPLVRGAHARACEWLAEVPPILELKNSVHSWH